MSNNTSIVRSSNTIISREPNVGFSLRSFDSSAVMAEYTPYVSEIDDLCRNKLYDEKHNINQDVLKEARNVYALLKNKADELNNVPFRVKEVASKVSRMSRSVGSDIFGIDYEAKKPTAEWISVEHAIQEVISFNWIVCSQKKSEGQAELDRLQKQIERRFGTAGLIVIGRDGKETLYKGFASSASHQKNEKLIMAKAESMDRHEKAIWFTLTKEQFLGLTVNGAAIWKMRANLLRPIRKEIKTKAGRVLTINDIQLVKDIVVTRHLDNARTVGNKTDDGEIFFDAPADIEKTMADGAVIYTGKDGEEDLGALEQWGQFCSYGGKGLITDARSCIETAARLEGKEIPNDLKPIMMGEGCWKFDKIGCSWAEFVDRCNEMAKTYPCLNKLYLLREGDELEGEVKIRRLTRSLIQQWIHMDAADIRKMTAQSRKALRRMKTMKGALSSLTEIGKPESERSEVSQVFAKAPWLILNPAVQQYLETRFIKKRNEAAANKIRTSGSYPYITEDLVAVAQIWIFGADANRNDLGVLAANEMSVADIPERKILAVRFPANYQTAAVRQNVVRADAFASCPNVCQISFYDDILVRQDGDVDGDEMAIIENDIAIKATEAMYEEFNPPVIVFAHGSKAEKKVLGTEAQLIATMYDDLWKAKRFDGVGKYANLATLCCHLASVAYAEGRMDAVKIHLNQMSLASTGAILAIDQVKGNAVSEELISRLEEISMKVRGMCDGKMPYTQQFVKGISSDKCLDESNSICDQIAGLIIRDAGEFEMETGAAVWNKTEAKRALLSFGDKYRITAVRKSPVIGTVLDKLADNWFNDKQDADRATFEAIRNHEAIGQKELLTLLWRNACALEFRMEGENLAAKRAEYLKTVREILYTQACSTKWVSKDGYVFSDNEKKLAVVNAAVSDALCLNGSNGIDADKRGSYAMFVLKVFAKELSWALNRNHPDSSLFMIDSCFDFDIDDETEELYSEEAGEIEEIEDDGMWIADIDCDYDFDC